MALDGLSLTKIQGDKPLIWQADVTPPVSMTITLTAGWQEQGSERFLKM